MSPLSASAAFYSDPAGLKAVESSPTFAFKGKEKLQAFTAISMAKAREPCQFDMSEGFRPFRRDVKWLKARDAPIFPLLDELDFSAGKRN